MPRKPQDVPSHTPTVQAGKAPRLSFAEWTEVATRIAGKSREAIGKNLPRPVEPRFVEGTKVSTRIMDKLRAEVEKITPRTVDPKNWRETVEKMAPSPRCATAAPMVPSPRRAKAKRGASPLHDWDVIDAEMRRRLDGQENVWFKTFTDQIKEWHWASTKRQPPSDSSIKRHLYALGYHSERGLIRKVRNST